MVGVSLPKAMTSPLTFVEYSDDWPVLFESEARLLREAFASEPVRIEHIGSTAVPGMDAKPIVDILLGAASLQAIERRIGTFVAHGYRYVPEYEGELPERRYFVKPAAGDERFHLHAVEADGIFWRDHLAVRDVLRTDRRTFEDYLALKRGLAESGLDRGGYTDAKAPFIQAVLATVRR
jgi:GrpB-like predicted nucleotidyltransferase (UPF0157 family)